MAFKGFGRDSGPYAPPKTQPLFGHFSRPPAYHNAPPSPPAFHSPTIQQLPRDLDAPEEPFSTSSPYNWIHPGNSSAKLNGDFSLPWSGQQNAVEKVSSRQMQKRHSEMAPQHPGNRTKSKIPRSQEQAQTSFFHHADESSGRSSKSDVSGGLSLSPPQLGAGSKVIKTTGGQPYFGPSTSANDMNADNAVSHAVPKRTRSPPSPSRQVVQGKSYLMEDDSERELQAKAKRLARFKAELSVPIENIATVSTKSYQPKPEKQRVFGDYTMDLAGDDVDNEHQPATGALIGLCPDMCPESEREERERKGDLDQYERLNGDRNHSSQDLAVKKYNRTAEREAELIRPMPILRKTMDYLLGLLDQPYDDRFLGLYNFLWDRMRAIRMDLRMQHIFNLDAISMLEQMIRLHIIAMHELCEYTKGEGFSEGFDAHLNIEQMNKTSVELFQMYDDHRKRGVDVPTEKEFRGYYALLKLDKHPGYKVEPAELSLDLAKMTPEIRKTQEVIFARNVARSCRTGNFIAFFRLARKATYLQACLMHAHFSKLRTQALASLQCGLQNNQGLPVAHVAKWLGLEGEGVEDLLEYHGFLIKEFEEPYVVKEGPFLNSDKDYPTQCSELVHLKKSKTIVEDVLFSHQAITQPSRDSEQLFKITDKNPAPVESVQIASSPTVGDEEMTDIKASSSPRSGMTFQHERELSAASHHGWNDQMVGASSSEDGFQEESNEPFKDYQHHGDEHRLADKGFQPRNFSLPKFIPDPQPVNFEWMAKQAAEFPAVISPKSGVVKSTHTDKRTQLKVIPSGIESGRAEENSTALLAPIVASPVQHDMVIDEFGDEGWDDAHQYGVKDLVITNQYDKEVSEAKLKLLLRLWRRCSVRKREMRKQNRLAADAALNSLSLGPPLKQSRDRPGSYARFNIDEIMSHRYDKYDRSWSMLNVADLVGDQLCKINASSQCICWKVVLYSQTQQEGDNVSLSYQASRFSVDQWLHSKIMPPSNDGSNDGLVTSSPGLAIWRKWILKSSGGSTCCLSVIKDLNSTDSFDNLVGANGILFPVSDILPWEHQKMQLHNLVASLPSGLAASLLILSGSNEEEFSDHTSTIFYRLSLGDLDKSRIRSFLVVYLYDSQIVKDADDYYSDEQLRKGLKWLATESLPQPALCYVKTRELVLAHLNSSLEALDRKGFHETGPNQCIFIFNEALDKSIGHIVTAANANPLGWPCHELSLLDDSTEEHRAVKWFLPSLGWSSHDKIQSLVSVLGHCKLPDFLDETTFLNRGCCTIDEFEEQRLHLQDCLISYLNQSSKLMNFTLSLKEASTMLQKRARLELHGTCYYLVPNWVLIFRRVFNWQLNRLSHKSCSTAYVLEQHHRLLMGPTKAELEVESLSIASSIYQPSLDEMVEVSFRRSPGFPKSSMPQPPSFQHVPTCPGDSEVLKKTSCPVDGEENNSRIQGVEDDVSLTNSSNFKDPSFISASGRAREADKLSRLFDQCSMLQNKIAAKLSVYF